MQPGERYRAGPDGRRIHRIQETRQIGWLIDHVPNIDAPCESLDDVPHPLCREVFYIARINGKPLRGTDRMIPDEGMALAEDSLPLAPVDHLVGRGVLRVTALRFITRPEERKRCVIQQRC